MEYKIERKKREYLDIFCKFKGPRYGIEIKYKTKKESNNFEYINQGAQNNSKCDFILDVHRIETFIKDNIIDIGYVIFITNDHRYWNSARNNTLVKKFDLIEGTILQGSYKPEWDSSGNERKKRMRRKLKGKYCICWHNSLVESSNEIAPFRFCCVKIDRDLFI